MMALNGLTNPAAGVTATRPTTMAVAAPTAVDLPLRIQSSSVQTTSVPAGASIVVVNAKPAMPFAAIALPALNPNHPNQSKPAPRSTKGTLCGIRPAFLKSRRGPTASTAASAATPALTCTTVPPAKSSAPIFASQPPAHTQCAIGAYTTTDQIVMKMT